MNPLTSPNAFFRRESEDPRLLPPAGIVLATALLGLITQYLLYSTILQSVDDGSGFVNLIMYGSMAVSFVGAFVMWFLYAGFFYLVSLVFDGEGSFGDLFKLVGWGYIPSLVSTVLTAGVYVAFLNGSSTSSPEGFTTTAGSLLDGPVLLVLTVIGIAVTVWRVTIFAFAVKHGRNLTLQQSAVVVALPALLSIGASIFTIVTQAL